LKLDACLWELADARIASRSVTASEQGLMHPASGAASIIVNLDRT
jgi:hypothetical protein